MTKKKAANKAKEIQRIGVATQGAGSEVSQGIDNVAFAGTSGCQVDDNVGLVGEAIRQWGSSREKKLEELGKLHEFSDISFRFLVKNRKILVSSRVQSFVKVDRNQHHERSLDSLEFMLGENSNSTIKHSDSSPQGITVTFPSYSKIFFNQWITGLNKIEDVKSSNQCECNLFSC